MDTKRFIGSLLLIIAIQIGVSFLLSFFNINGISFIILYSLIIAFIFAMINYPVRDFKIMFTDPYFYRNACICFIVLFLLNWLF